MTMSKATFSAFGDELVKIALYQTMRNGFVNALKEGWHGTPEQIATNEGSTWFGKGRQIKPGMSRLGRMGEEFASLGGATRALPVGAKSMMAVGTGLMAREALKPNDPTGLQRSRIERVTGLAGNTLGGLVGSAIGNRIMPGLAGSVGGGILGGMLGEKATTLPFSMTRRAPPQQPVNQTAPTQGFSG